MRKKVKKVDGPLMSLPVDCNADRLCQSEIEIEINLHSISDDKIWTFNLIQKPMLTKDSLYFCLFFSVFI